MKLRNFEKETKQIINQYRHTAMRTSLTTQQTMNLLSQILAIDKTTKEIRKAKTPQKRKEKIDEYDATKRIVLKNLDKLKTAISDNPKLAEYWLRIHTEQLLSSEQPIISTMPGLRTAANT